MYNHAHFKINTHKLNTQPGFSSNLPLVLITVTLAV